MAEAVGVFVEGVAAVVEPCLEHDHGVDMLVLHIRGYVLCSDDGMSIRLCSACRLKALISRINGRHQLSHASIVCIPCLPGRVQAASSPGACSSC
jgi:hypothetical protein